MLQTQAKFYTIRYVPDLVRNEGINIGILLISIADSLECCPRVQITKNWNRVLRLDPDADTDMLSRLEESLQRYVDTPSPGDQRTPLEKLEDSLSNTLQLQRHTGSVNVSITNGKVVLSDALVDELKQLMLLYVEERSEIVFDANASTDERRPPPRHE